ncbi:major facilitator superfamily domain-containing protein [Aspergillus ambiguus]|uniref:putative tetracycline-efflux transporter n=1 Tax=Aspergillus ambiguus TaxID=176160 RepID=UPI003CCE43C2
MDNRAALAGDVTVDAQLRPRATASRDSDTQRTLEDDMADTLQLHGDEQTPLLSQSRGEADPADWEPSQDDVDHTSSSLLASWRKPSVFWLLPFLLLYMLSFGGPVVPKINLMISLICRDYMQKRAAADPGFTYLPVVIGKDNPQCQIPEVQSLVSRFQLVFNLIAGILSALVSPRLGRLSDRYGRTRVIALSVLWTLFAESNILFVAANQERMSVNMLLPSAILEGIGGSFTTMMALTTSYASDCTSAKKRSVAFGYVHGSVFIGVAAGPLLVAYLIKRTSTILSVFYSSVILNAVFLLAVLFIIPESLSKDRQESAREKRRARHAQKEKVGWLALQRWSPKRIFTPLAILYPRVGRPSPLFPYPSGATSAIRRNILLLCGIDTVLFGLSMGASQIVIIYAEYMFGWGNIESSLYISLVCFVRVFNLFAILPVVAWLFRRQRSEDHEVPGSDQLDVVLIRVSVFLDLVGHAGMALAGGSALMLFSGVIAALGGMGSPTLQSSLTKHVPHERIGQILGAKGLLHALSRVVAPTACSLIYSVTVANFPQAVFVCLSGAFLLILGCSFFIIPYASLPGAPIHDDGHTEANPDGEEVDTLLRESTGNI